MKNLFVTPRLQDYLKNHNKTYRLLSEELEISEQFLHAVLGGKKPCPLWLCDRLARQLKLNPHELRLAFGHMPDKWLTYCQKNPGEAYKIIQETA